MSVCACVSALSVHENCGLIPEVLVSCVRCRKFKAFCHYSSTGHQRLQRETFHSVSDSNVLHTWHFNQKSRQSKLSTKSGVIIRHQCLLSPLTMCKDVHIIKINSIQIAAGATSAAPNAKLISQVRASCQHTHTSYQEIKYTNYIIRPHKPLKKIVSTLRS